MMEISKKYSHCKTPDQMMKEMIQDGIIPTSVIRHDEILYTYKASLKKGMSNSDAVNNTSLTHNCSERLVYQLVKRYF